MKDKRFKNHNNWATPKKLYDELNDKYNFDFDPCPLYAEFDGLSISWGERNFINPPYSRKLKEAFVKKAIEESKKEKLCVMLLPVSTSSVLFHDYILPNMSDIHFIKGRIAFEGVNSKGIKTTKGIGMHDSMLVIFDGTGIHKI